MEKAIVQIKGKEYRLKFKIGFWKDLKEKADVTQSNLEQKLKDDFGTVAGLVIYYGIYYGLSPRIEKIEEMNIKISDIENELDYSVMDAIEEAVIDGMTKSQKEILELAERLKKNELKEMVESSKKK